MNRYFNHYHRYQHPAVLEEQRRANNRRRWKALGRNIRNIGDRARMTTTVRGAHDKSFRLVDRHGRVHGQRYTGQATWRLDVAASRYYFLAEDSRGRELWLPANTNVRIVSRQAEDLHSQLSRMLKAAHRNAA